MSTLSDNQDRIESTHDQRAVLPCEQIDRCRLEAFLGAGAMGRVYSAVHVVTNRRCALKLLPDELSRQPAFVARFRAEAQTLAHLNHPNIVQIYNGGEADGRLFLEMEYIDGGDLQRRVTDFRKETGHGLPESEARRILDEILSALDYAHREHVIHRDLKPANIMLRKDGAVKVSDFGLAVVVGEDFQRSIVNESISLTKITSLETVLPSEAQSSGSFAGTVLYMSPQALRGEPVDPRDDLFSVGVIAYFMLTGKTPTVNYTPISQLRPDLNRGWDKFIATCLADERTARYPTAGEARLALPAARRRRPLLVPSLVGLAVLLAVGGVWFFRPSIKPPPGKASAVALPPAPRMAQEITFAPIVDCPVGAPPFTVVASASSGLPVGLAIVSGPATLTGSTVTATGPGIVKIRATQPGNDRFAAAPALECSFRVTESVSPTPRKLQAQTIAAQPVPDHVFGDPPVEIHAQASSGLPVTIAVVSGPAIATENRLALTGIGTVRIRLGQAGSQAFLPAENVEYSFQVKDPVPDRLTVPLPGGIEMTFARIPAGSAMLGSPPGETGHRPDEVQHEFARPEAFLMGITEVTQAQYAAVMGKNPSYHRLDGQRRPVEQVLFTDLVGPGAQSQGFLAQFNALLRRENLANWEAVLPSEDEWEYACRAGTTTALNNNANLTNPIRDRNASAVAVYSGSETAPVATLAPNAWGLYDMHGNVAEWTREGVLRGGSFRDDAVACRAATRLRGQNNNPIRDNRFGLRLMLRRVPAR